MSERAKVEQRHYTLAGDLWQKHGESGTDAAAQLLADFEAEAERRGAESERERTCGWEWTDDEGWQSVCGGCLAPDLDTTEGALLGPFCCGCGGRIVTAPASEEHK